MSDRHFGHEMWLSKLADHSLKERYAAGTSRQCIAAARNFLSYLDKQRLDIRAAGRASVERYLQHARQIYRRRHGGPPDYRGWRCLHTNGIHMPLRLVQGQWRPASLAATRAEIRGEYVRWMIGQRGLAQETVARRCSEAGRFLEWLGQGKTRQELALLT